MMVNSKNVLKYPWVKWFPADWLSESEIAKTSLEARGLWMEVLNCMIRSDSDTLAGTPDELSRCLRCLPSEFSSALDNLKATGVAEIEVRNGIVKFVSRRRAREQNKKVGARERAARFRNNGGGDPDRWTAIRVDILRRDNYLCAYCERKAKTVDHVHPKSRGGTEDYWNLVGCCKPCSNKKTNRTPQEAGMKFRKTFNISVLEKSNTKITLSAYASAYDLSGKGGAGEKEVEPPPLPPGFPVTVDDALRQCSVSCGHIPKDFTMHCHDKAVSRGGEDSHKVPIRDFGAYVRTQWKYEQNRTGEQASNGKSSLPAWRQLQHLQDAIDSHPANRESVHHRDDCTQSQKDDLRAKRKALAELKAA